MLSSGFFCQAKLKRFCFNLFYFYRASQGLMHLIRTLKLITRQYGQSEKNSVTKTEIKVLTPAAN